MLSFIENIVGLTHGDNCRVVCDTVVPVITECLTPCHASDFLCKLSDGLHQLPLEVNELIHFLETSTGCPFYILGPVTVAALAGTQWGLNAYKNHLENAFEKNLKRIIKAKFGDKADVVYELLQPIIRQHLTALLTNFTESFGMVSQQAFLAFKRCLKEDTTKVLQVILDKHQDEIKALIKEKKTASLSPKNKPEENPDNDSKTDLNTLFNEYCQKEKKEIAPASPEDQKEAEKGNDSKIDLYKLVNIYYQKQKEEGNKKLKAKG